jgi:glutathione S-transferase
MLLYVDVNFASPYALVAFVSLLEKGVAFDIKTVDLAAQDHHRRDFSKTSITRRVPTLVHDGARPSLQRRVRPLSCCSQRH